MSAITEELAIERWCPFARVILERDDGRATYPAAFNRLDYVGAAPTQAALDTAALCIASGCMAWRWRRPFPAPNFRRADDECAMVEPPRPSDVPPSWKFEPHDPEVNTIAGWIEPQNEVEQRYKGFCGLAGAP